MRREYAESDLPDGDALGRGEIVNRLKKIALWGLLPASELHKECETLGVPTGEVELTGTDEEVRKSYADQLYTYLYYLPAWDTKGFPWKRMHSPQEAVSIVQEYRRYGGCGDGELLEAYREMGFPEEKGLEKEENLQVATCGYV